MKILVAEDEPLVLIGIKTLLQNSSLHPSLCPTASNGSAALDIIEKERPDIVITDIRMPKMDGLELIRTCRERYGETPVFIILTNYEEFPLAKEALSLGVSDYLVKLELTEDILDQSLSKAMRRLVELRPSKTQNPPQILDALHKERFFIRLLNNLFEDEEQFILQNRDLGLSFSEYDGFITCYLELSSPKAHELNQRQQANLFASSFDMIQSMAPRYLPCCCVSLDMRHLALIFMTAKKELPYAQTRIQEALNNICSMVKSYYSVGLSGACGLPVSHPLAIHESYQRARYLFIQNKPYGEVYFPEDSDMQKEARLFNMSLFKDDLIKAYEEYDSEKLSSIVDAIADLFTDYPVYYVQAMDAASNFLYLSLSLISNGEELVSSIFASSPSGYRSLYTLTTTGQVTDWLRTLCRGLCVFFDARKKDYKSHLITEVRQYIQLHISEKLPLNEVAAAFGISPGYLSQLFRKYSDCGFTEYISQQRITRAKELIQEGNLKIYEIAEQLGFENAFYFSKVFKRVEGCSPREYQYQWLGNHKEE